MKVTDLVIRSFSAREGVSPGMERTDSSTSTASTVSLHLEEKVECYYLEHPVSHDLWFCNKIHYDSIFGFTRWDRPPHNDGLIHKTTTEEVLNTIEQMAQRKEALFREEDQLIHYLKESGVNSK